MELKVQELQAQQQAAVIPSLIGSVVVGGYDPRDGSLRALNLGVLIEALQQAEVLHTEDKLDERNQKKLTIPAGTGSGVTMSAALEVPTGEVWYLNRLALTTPADVTANILVSKFPRLADGTDKPYLPTDLAAGSTVNYDLAAVGQLGADLRLVGGDKLTIRATTTAGIVADVDVVLVPYGRKARKLL
jgi:hypothetical protein